MTTLCWLMTILPFTAAGGAMLARSSIQRGGTIHQGRYWGGLGVMLGSILALLWLLRLATLPH